MKNIHILPTDRPSRLAGSEYITNELGIDKRAFKLKLWDKIIPNKDLRDVGYIPQHIYITNDESLKKGKEDLGSYYLDWKGNITKKQNSDWQITFLNDFKKKIILTTDQDLIKDGVQAIDDEFLEWFVKNPSCEEVEVKYNYVCSNCNEDKNNPKYENCHGNYRTHKIFKIIIPKEEPNFYEKLVEYFKNTPREKVLEDWNKTAECDNIGPTVEEFLGNTEEPKQEYQSECICDTECRGFVNVKCKKSKKETLEEAAVRLYPDNIIKLGNETSYNAALLKRKDFIDGGNWVKERMYSEEDIREAIHESRMQDDKYEDCVFEQFKKK